jgi:hypothetical protein
MSFILDALRKVEQEKRQGAATLATAGEGRAARLERSKRRRLHTLMIVTALLSAGLTVVVLRLLPRTPVDAEPHAAGLETASDAGSAAPEEPQTEKVSVEPESIATAPAPKPALRSEEVVTAAGKKTNATPARSRPKPESVAAAATTTRPPPVEPEPEPTRESVAVSEPIRPPEDDSPSADSSPEQTAAPIRLVGPAERGGPSGMDTDADPSPSEPSSPPADLPHLVLQGTSVVDGHPVAVISDRRVFEGDTIEGAVVIRIQERSVELELDGHRFTLSL